MYVKMCCRRQWKEEEEEEAGAEMEGGVSVSVDLPTLLIHGSPHREKSPHSKPTQMSSEKQKSQYQKSFCHSSDPFISSFQAGYFGKLSRSLLIDC